MMCTLIVLTQVVTHVVLMLSGATLEGVLPSCELPDLDIGRQKTARREAHFLLVVKASICSICPGISALRKWYLLAAKGVRE